MPLAATCVGTSLVALCRAGERRAARRGAAHPPARRPVARPRRRRLARAADPARRRRRRSTRRPRAGSSPPRHLARLREAADAPRAAAAPCALGARARRGRAPRGGAARARRAGRATGRRSRRSSCAPGVAAAELLERARRRSASCRAPSRPTSPTRSRRSSRRPVPRWRGPATGRVRIMSPYRARAARARALFFAGLQEGEFPSAAPPDPLLSEERRARARQPRPAPRRPGRRGALPVPRLRLAPDRAPVPVLAELRRGRRGAGALAVRRRGPRPGRRRRRDRPSGCSACAAPSARVIDAGEATTPRAARAGAGARRLATPTGRATLARLGVAPTTPPRRSPRSPACPTRGAARARCARPRVLDELGARRAFSANSLEGWVDVLRTAGSSTTSSRRSASTPTPTRCGSAASSTRRSSGSTASRPAPTRSPGPATSGAGAPRFAELLDEVAASESATLTRRGRAALERARAQVEAFLARRGATRDRVPPRPRAARARLRRARHEPEDAPQPRPALELGEFELRGRIDRIDLAADGRSAIVATTRPARRSPSARQVRRARARSRSSSTCWSRGGSSGSTRSAASTSRSAPPARGPRARGASPTSDDERLAGSTSSRPTATAEEFEECSSDAEALAIEAAAAMRAGRSAATRSTASARRYCTYQPICRLERALGDVGDERRTGGDEHERRASSSPSPTSSPRARRGRASRSPSPRPEPTPEQAAAIAARAPRRLPRGGRRHRQDPRARRPLLRRDRRRRGRGRPDPRLHLHRARGGRDADAGSARELARRSRAAATRGDPERADGCSALARATERAWVTTIHGFCRRLLAAHPLAAGLDPRFRVLDAEPGRAASRPGLRARRSTSCSPPATSRSRAPPPPTSRGGWRR